MNKHYRYPVNPGVVTTADGAYAAVVQRWWLLAMLLLTLSLIAGCSSDVLDSQRPPAISAADVGKPLVWGQVNNVVRVKHLYFSSQPDEAALAQARGAGVDVVINLREPQEMTWDEAAAAARQSLVYYQVPLSGAGESFNQEAIQRIGEIVAANHDKQIWLHCSSGNRAAAWLAVHLVQDHDMRVDQALARARQAGITKLEVEERVRTYLASPVVQK